MDSCFSATCCSRLVGANPSCGSGKGRSHQHPIKYGFSLVKGKANHPMEDFHVAKFVHAKGHELGLFAIYDGHLGDTVPAYLQKHLFSNILKEEEFWTDTNRSISKAYERTDQAILTHTPELGRGGSTAVTAILIDGEKLWIANVGDSRGVLSKRGQAIQVTVDHEPSTERGSIENRGGFVSNMPASDIGRLVVVRPSCVLGGRAMEIIYSDDKLATYLETAVEVNPERPVLIDMYLSDAIEIDVDALVDSHGNVVVGGIMKHIEQAGIHSGDSACSLSTKTVPSSCLDIIRSWTTKLAKSLKVRGLMNCQYAITASGEVYLLEANPRASRTVPFVSKAIGHPLAKYAVLVMSGNSLRDLSGWLGDVPRVNGQLAVSRAFGDKSLKSHLRSDPDVRSEDLNVDTDLLILASDGVWKVMSNQEAVDIAKKCRDPQKAAKLLTAEALDRDSKDDISCIVVKLRG